MAADDFVIIESEDGYTFSVPRRIVMASGTLKAMLDEEGEQLSVLWKHAVSGSADV